MSQATFEKICEFSSNLSSPVEIDGQIYLVAQNGEVLVFKDGQLKSEFKFGVQLSSLAIDDQFVFYIADMAHQCIYTKNQDDRDDNVTELVKDFEGNVLLGPNSIVVSEDLSSLFFTDSGPFGETSLENPKGSVFIIDLEELVISSLALNCLAYPSGLALTEDQKILYVSETCANRVLRFVLTDSGVYYHSVHVQFSGRYGPTSCVVSPSDLLYVARYEFGTLTDEGLISVVNSLGQIKENISLPGAPEITGLTFSKQKSNILYATENSNTPCCIRVLVQTEGKEEDKKNMQDLKDIKLN